MAEQFAQILEWFQFASSLFFARKKRVLHRHTICLMMVILIFLLLFSFSLAPFSAGKHKRFGATATQQRLSGVAMSNHGAPSHCSYRVGAVFCCCCCCHIPQPRTTGSSSLHVKRHGATTTKRRLKHLLLKTRRAVQKLHFHTKLFPSRARAHPFAMHSVSEENKQLILRSQFSARLVVQQE